MSTRSALPFGSVGRKSKQLLFSRWIEQQAALDCATEETEDTYLLRWEQRQQRPGVAQIDVLGVLQMWPRALPCNENPAKHER